MKWTDEMIATAVGMRRAGIPVKVVAARLGVSSSALTNRMGRLGAHAKLTHKRGTKTANTAYGRLTHIDAVDIEDAPSW